MWPMFTISYCGVYIDIVGSSARSKCEKIYSFPTSRHSINCPEVSPTKTSTTEKTMLAVFERGLLESKYGLYSTDTTIGTMLVSEETT